MKSVLNRFVSDESGATAIEYGLIAAMMAVAIVTIFGTLGTDLKTGFANIGNTLKTPPAVN